MYDFISTIYTALNVTAVTNLLDTYGTGKALFADSLIPADCGVWKTINFYQSGSEDYGLDYGQVNFSVNCRAQTRAEASAIAEAVLTRLNRTNFGNFYIVGAKLPILNPADETDSYNQPVEITLKAR